MEIELRDKRERDSEFDAGKKAPKSYRRPNTPRLNQAHPIGEASIVTSVFSWFHDSFKRLVRPSEEPALLRSNSNSFTRALLASRRRARDRQQARQVSVRSEG